MSAEKSAKAGNSLPASKFDEVVHGTARTRRNVFKIATKLGAVAGAAVAMNLAKSGRAAAHDSHHWHWWRHHKKDHHNSHHCFLEGTTIRTIDGDRKVEDLAIGCMVPAMFGGTRPIQWVGHYSLKKSDPSKPWIKDARPVRIARSAFGPNIPHADLFVTSGHAIYFDGILVPAGSLVNGTTIALYGANEFSELKFYHIKLENHDVIYAEGAPCETLLEVTERAVNFAEYYRMFGVPPSEPVPCVPVVSYNGGRSEIKSRLRSALSPWIDRREKIDVIRDRLEERGLSLG